MFTIACCSVVGLLLGLGLGLDLVSGWLKLLCTRIYTTFDCHCHTVIKTPLLSHCSNKNVFSNCLNQLCPKSGCLRPGGR